MFISIAPMEGVFDFITREILTEVGGFDQCVTEFIRVTHQLIPDKVFLRYAPELLNEGKTTSGVPVFLQLLGGNPNLLAENAHKAYELGALGIDLNFGCPAKTVNRHDGGATLLKNPERLFNIISKIKSILPPEVPVTSKVRLGFEDKSLCKDIAQASCSGGATRLTVHARTKIEGYKPPAHWEYIAQMKDHVQIPVIANGDIWSPEDYLRCVEVSGCKDISLGRPAFARPDLAKEIRATQKPKGDKPTYSPMSAHQVLETLFLKFGKRSADFKDEKFAVNRSKQWARYLGRTYPGVLDLFQEIKRLKTLVEIQECTRKKIKSLKH